MTFIASNFTIVSSGKEKHTTTNGLLGSKAQLATVTCHLIGVVNVRTTEEAEPATYGTIKGTNNHWWITTTGPVVVLTTSEKRKRKNTIWSHTCFFSAVFSLSLVRFESCNKPHLKL